MNCRVFLYDLHSTSFLLLAESLYHDRCVLKISHIKHQNESNTTVLCTTDTAGKLVFFDLTELLIDVCTALNTMFHEGNVS